MEDDPDQPLAFLQILLGLLNQSWADNVSITLVYAAIILVLIFLSAVFSASENAFFSLGPNELVALNEMESSSAQTVIRLINEPDRTLASKYLLATILLLNNFVNITIVILSTLAINNIFDFSAFPVLAFLIQVVAITFFLVMFGEIIPKIYSTQNNVKIALATALPLFWLQKITFPVVWLLTKSTFLFDKFLDTASFRVSVEELNQAIEIAGTQQNNDEKNILKGLVNYGSINVKQIMRSRMDITAIELESSLEDITEKIKEWGYSRLPVYEENIDNIKGILYIKDLVPFLKSENNFNWHELIRSPFFVPEFKKIDDLLNEFQEKRMHLAIVVDEYGGTSGLISMEDVLEEIFGEIKDEFDEDETSYSILDENTFLFEAKTPVNDMCKIAGVDADYFDDIKGEADTLGGIIMETARRIPQRGFTMQHKEFTFIVEAADKRRILRVKAIFAPVNEENQQID